MKDCITVDMKYIPETVSINIGDTITVDYIGEIFDCKITSKDIIEDKNTSILKLGLSPIAITIMDIE